MRTNIPDINHAWYLTEKFDFLNSMMMSGRATSNPTANKHHMMRNHLRRGHLQNAKTLAMLELGLSTNTSVQRPGPRSHQGLRMLTHSCAARATGNRCPTPRSAGSVHATSCQSRQGHKLRGTTGSFATLIPFTAGGVDILSETGAHAHAKQIKAEARGTG